MTCLQPALIREKKKKSRCKGWRSLWTKANNPNASSMKTIVLLLAFKLCCSDLGPDENNAKLGQGSGCTSCCNIYSLTSVTQTVGELKEKVANMEEKVTFLETRLQSTEKEVLELRSLIGGNRFINFMMTYITSWSNFPKYLCYA